MNKWYEFCSKDPWLNWTTDDIVYDRKAGSIKLQRPELDQNYLNTGLKEFNSIDAFGQHLRRVNDGLEPTKRRG